MAVDEFVNPQSWTDRGEIAVFARVADETRGAPVLDVGVGGGRTTAFLRLLTDDYTGVDYTPEMVALCRQNHPGVTVLEADARDLSMFEDDRFGLVVFSFNGIDAVDHQDRGKVLSEFFRVLRPGGLLLMSTHNKDGPTCGEVPWRRPHFAAPPLYRAARWVFRAPTQVPRYVRSYRNWYFNRRYEVDGDGWSMRTAGAHDFGIVIHYVTMRAAIAELEETKFRDIEVRERDRGDLIARGDETAAVPFFHLVARKPGG